MGFFYFFLEPSNLFYLGAIIIMLIGETTISMYPGILYIILLGILLLFRLVSFMIFDYKRHVARQSSGKAKILRATRATIKGSRINKEDLELNTDIQGELLCVGDMVRLKKYDIVPCDCLVLAASDKIHTDYICFVDTTASDGSLKRIQKQSLEITKSFTPLTFKETTARQFVRRITGKIDINPYDNACMTFSGSIKLKSDPKVEEITNKNVLTKGSIIRSRFCFALVIATGADCSTLNYSRIRRGKRSSITKTVNMYAIISIAMNLLISLVSIMTMYVRTKG
jgi:magnesium-transporting ATPase (P-type)